eukprot:gene33587-43462_t
MASVPGPAPAAASFQPGDGATPKTATASPPSSPPPLTLTEHPASAQAREWADASF